MSVARCGAGAGVSAGGDQCPHTGTSGAEYQVAGTLVTTGHQETRTWGHGALLCCTTPPSKQRCHKEQNRENIIIKGSINYLIAFKLNIIFIFSRDDECVSIKLLLSK